MKYPISGAAIALGLFAISPAPAQAADVLPMVDPQQAVSTCGPCVAPALAYDVGAGVVNAVVAVVAMPFSGK